MRRQSIVSSTSDFSRLLHMIAASHKLAKQNQLRAHRAAQNDLRAEPREQSLAHP